MTESKLTEIREITPETHGTKTNPLFIFMTTGSLLYAFFYTLFLYKNNSGITYPFFVGGTCLLFFLYMKKSGITAKKFTVFPLVSLLLLGLSTCLTDSYVLIFFNKVGIFFLFFYMMLHNLYEDKKWDLAKYTGSVFNIIFTGITYIFRPFTDFSTYYKNKASENTANGNPSKDSLLYKKARLKYIIKYILFGILIALPLLFIILLLLYQADAVFSSMLDKIFTFHFYIDFEDDIYGIISMFLFAFFASYAIMSRIGNHNLKEEIPDKRTKEPIMGITFTGIISLVYLVFCYIQVVYLFGGFGSLPANYTYSSYAREGFFQLVFVCIINLALVLSCMKRFCENIILKGILTFISICTYIMIASGTYRMILYIQAYYLTFLRIFVLWALLVILLLISGALLMIYREKFPFTKYCIITVTSLYILFSFSRPDYWIAAYNLSNSSFQSNRISYDAESDNQSRNTYNDYYYLQRLSNDAAPVIFAKAKELGYEQNDWFLSYAANIVYNHTDWSYPEKIENHLPQKLPLRKWNFSRWRAIQIYTHYFHANKEFAQKIAFHFF